MNNKLDNIVVLGGGTAGWITALMVNKRVPTAQVTVIESEDIGILGAGEGTTPMFINFLQYVGIPISDVIRETRATFKNGLKFTNWNGDGSYYYHEFSPIPDLLNSHKAFQVTDNFGKHIPFYWLNVYKDEPKAEFDFMSMVTEYGRAPFIHRPNFGFKPDILEEHELVGRIGLHFNATLMANFLKKTALSRGIARVEGKVTEVNSKDNGDIESLTLEDGSIIPLDFVFDCSGFYRVLIGKHYGSEWRSSKDITACDTAIPFFLPIDDEIPPYTECVALKHGWVWKIPLQDRYGCGYVFSSNFINSDEAKAEVEEYFNQSVNVIKTIPFNPGHFKSTWVNNCIAIGIASGFVEPLEATNIAVALNDLTNALTDLSALTRRSDQDKALYNNQVDKLDSEIEEFLYIHYITQRSDTDFWVQFKDLNKAPKRIKSLIEALPTALPSYAAFTGWDAFNYGSFYQIVGGNGLLNEQLIKDAVIKNNLTGDAENNFVSYKEYLREEARKCVNHKVLLTQIGGFKYE